MENRLNLLDQTAKKFKVKEGSNYKIIDSFQNEYVIDYTHFQNLNNSLFFGEGDFTTINNDIINKRYIYRITPTDEKTEVQKDRGTQIEEEKLKAKKQDDEEFAKYASFRKEWLDKKYGENKWSMFKEGIEDGKSIQEDYNKNTIENT